MRAGLTDILIITGRDKRAIEDHFDRNFELEHYLEQRRQARPPEGGAVLGRRSPTSTTCASATRSVSATRSRSRVITSATSRSRCCSPTTSWSTTALLPLDARRRTSARPFGDGAAQEIATRGDLVVRLRRPGRRTGATVSSSCSGIVEKPPREEAPSNLAVIGRYVFTPEIFDALDRIEPGRGGELQLTDAIALLLEEQRVFGATVRRRSLRRRPEARLPARQRRARARSARPRPAVAECCATSLRERRPCDAGSRDPARRRAAAILDAVAPLAPPGCAPARRARSRARGRRHRDRSRFRRSRTPRWTGTRCAPPTRGRGRAGALRVVGELPAGRAPTIAGRARARRSAS